MTTTTTEHRIRQLPPDVVNKIAAGEVVERPASVVKELLENSVDALASRIDVELEAGGAELIRVVDDGEGIAPGDLPLAVASHATSKIESADDLFGVRTMGFRGEALASSASISRCRIRSRRHDAQAGAELLIEGGAVGDVKTCGCPPGTSIEIRGLFANTPVRRKFLRTPGTEFGHAAEQFTRIALANPRLHLTLKHNGRIVHELPATTELADRLQRFHGRELVEQLIPVDSETDGVRLWGYVAHPGQSKSTRKGQYLFLNGRFIQDRSLQHALGEAYRGLLMTGRFPIAFLFLEMAPELADVNVHPTKSEVRFRDGQQLYRQLLACLRNRFLGMELDGTASLGASAVPKPPVDPQRQRELELDFVKWAKEELAAAMVTPIEDRPRVHELPEEDELRNAPLLKSRQGGLQNPQASLDAAPSDEDIPQSAIRNPQSQRVMQVHDCYLVLESEEGLTVVDQHALHERILYEQLRERVLNGKLESQRMLVPEPVELADDETAALRDNADLLGDLGFGIEEFGGNTLLLSAYPAMLPRADHGQLLKDVAERILSADAVPDRRDLLDHLLHTMACRAAIKAGQRLSAEEMETLLAQRHHVENSHHCPHGRPTALVLSRHELDRQFGRLG